MIEAACVLTPEEEISPGAVIIENGIVASVGQAVPAPADAEVVRLPDATLIPGFIDLHVHGGGGFSLATNNAEATASYARWAVSHGVTSFLATICAGSIEEGLEYVRAAAASVGPIPGGATLLGLNLEGPFLSPQRRGALPEQWLAPPDIRLFDGFCEAAGGHLRMMTLAPELPGAARVLRTAVSRGIVVSVGHTDADYETAQRAFEAGATHVTHAFNAMCPFHHREPGPIGAALHSTAVTVEAIADGVHLHPATVALLVRAFGPDRLLLVTDAVTPAGLSAGTFRIGSEEARLEEGRIFLPDGTIAGSAATMDEMVRNVVEWGIVPLGDAARMTSGVAAGVVGLAARKGRIAPGYDADLVALDRNLTVLRTWVGGTEAPSLLELNET